MSQPRRPHRSTPGRGPGESTWPVSSSSRKAFTRNDLTGQAAAMMQTLLTLPPSPIGLQAFVPDFESKATNLTAALADGRLRAVQGVARAV